MQTAVRRIAARARAHTGHLLVWRARTLARQEKENIVNLQPIMRAVLCAALVVVCAVASNSKTIASGPNGSVNGGAETAHDRAGVRNTPGKQRLNADQLNQVLQSLREKTGWQALDFDEAGFLVCPDPRVYSGGSEAA